MDHVTQFSVSNKLQIVRGRRGGLTKREWEWERERRMSPSWERGWRGRRLRWGEFHRAVNHEPMNPLPSWDATPYTCCYIFHLHQRRRWNNTFNRRFPLTDNRASYISRTRLYVQSPSSVCTRGAADSRCHGVTAARTAGNDGERRGQGRKEEDPVLRPLLRTRPAWPATGGDGENQI